MNSLNLFQAGCTDFSNSEEVPDLGNWCTQNWNSDVPDQQDNSDSDYSVLAQMDCFDSSSASLIFVFP